LLAWLPEEEVEAVLPLLAPKLAARYALLTVPRLREEIQRSRDQGYALLLDVVVDQMGGIAVPVLGADGKPTAALSVAALSQRITSRLDTLVPALKQEAAELSVADAYGEPA
jgi:DNA-binding IclR family transcriptional regulator